MNAFDFLKWVLSDLWRIVGFVIVVGSTCDGLATIVRAVLRVPEAS
jgi:hypothetical protein